MLPSVFVIKNVVLWNADRVETQPTRLKIENGQVTQIGPDVAPLNADFEFDGGGHVLMPSGVDGQVHLRTPGQEQKEKPETGLQSALCGGVGALVTMPNTNPVIDSPQTVDMALEKIKEAQKITGIKVLLSAAMTLGQKGHTPVDALQLKSKKVVALTDDGKGVQDSEVMDLVFQEAEKSGLPLLQHAEFLGHGGCVAPSSKQKEWNLVPIPDESEWKMVERDLELLKKYPKVKYHLLHASLRKSVELILAAKKMGLHASCEVSPHHLLFCAEDIQAGDTSYKMNPPLRSALDRDFLVESLAKGGIDFVATDHAPHEAQVKTADYGNSAFGTTGLEASLKVLLKLWREKKLEATRLVEVFSAAPARFYGISQEFGYLRVGSPLRAILVDVHQEPKKLADTEIYSLSKNSIFRGLPLPGRVLAHFNESGLFRFSSF
jgi:dihydroorotase